MNFVDRTSLGTVLAHKLQQFHGKNAIIVCLQESSLLTCVTIASHIRAWVYPLVYVPVYSSDHSHQLLGAYDIDGDFCPYPDGPAAGKKVAAAIKTAIKKQRPAAMKTIRAQAESFGLALDKRRLSGRDVIIAADVITSTLPLVVAQHVLKGVAPKSLTAVVGNATPAAAELVRLSAAKTDIMDILSGIVFDDNHYFEHDDTYTPEQKHTLTEHIATYWR